MLAATIEKGAVVVRAHPDPLPGPGEVLVRVRSAGVNSADLLQRAGRYPAPPRVRRSTFLAWSWPARWSPSVRAPAGSRSATG